MDKIKGYFLYHISMDIHFNYFFVFPYKVYSTLQGAKNAKILKDKEWYVVKNSAWIIVPVRYPFDRKSKIKYINIAGYWSTNIPEQYANVFYKWRGTDCDLNDCEWPDEDFNIEEEFV